MTHKITWNSFFRKEKKQPYFIKIFNFIKKEKKQGKIIFPDQKNIFTAFKLTEFKNIKVVVLGQDPYSGLNQAHGLSFSVLSDTKIPPSLNNIFKELSNNFIDFKKPKNGCLIPWAKQGILLLNTILTVEKNKPSSHLNIGWEIFTNKIISLISSLHIKIVFLLWGKQSKKKSIFINPNKHLILSSSHPSPLSAHNGFFNCFHFYKTNKFLMENKKMPINWNIL